MSFAQDGSGHQMVCGVSLLGKRLQASKFGVCQHSRRRSEQGSSDRWPQGPRTAHPACGALDTQAVRSTRQSAPRGHPDISGRSGSSWDDPEPVGQGKLKPLLLPLLSKTWTMIFLMDLDLGCTICRKQEEDLDRCPLQESQGKKKYALFQFNQKTEDEFAYKVERIWLSEHSAATENNPVPQGDSASGAHRLMDHVWRYHCEFYDISKPMEYFLVWMEYALFKFNQENEDEFAYKLV
ncbi:uncharacterized protein LOC143644838 isoform X2 [Tamandua tetradactyla]|uniref:uncharacterized protein LOC143644838 isoform X2 n=1 Tax=Tamandua tetradactyla TaxID=48850 RepID=UPI00405472EA